MTTCDDDHQNWALYPGRGSERTRPSHSPRPETTASRPRGGVVGIPHKCHLRKDTTSIVVETSRRLPLIVMKSSNYSTIRCKTSGLTSETRVARACETGRHRRRTFSHHDQLTIRASWPSDEPKSSSVTGSDRRWTSCSWSDASCIFGACATNYCFGQHIRSGMQPASKAATVYLSSTLPHLCNMASWVDPLLNHL